VHDPLVTLVIIGLFIGLPIYYMVWASGWPTLQDIYKIKTLDGLISGGSYRLVYCRSRWIWLLIALEIYPTGLWLRNSFPLNIFMPSVLIPWEGLTLAQSRAWIFSGTRLQVSGWPYSIEILGRAGRAVREKVTSL